MNVFLSLLAGLLSGLIGAMGMGGGAVLIIYLTVFAGVERFKAQGINLLFFIPIAVVALIVYIKRKSIDFKTVLSVSSFGVLGALCGIFSAGLIGKKYISLIFGTGLIILGLKELYTGIKTILERRKQRCYNKKE